MKIDINYPQLAAEFVIVFVGVAVALAADGWREGFQERELESRYIDRLENDLRVGASQLESGLENAAATKDALRELIKMLEDPTYSLSNDELVENYMYASRIGYNSTGLEHDWTYRELISTGRLNLLQSQEILIGISQYYRLVGVVDLVREDNPRYMIERFTALIGRPPYSESLPLSQVEKERVLFEIENSPILLEELRKLHNRHVLLVDNSRYSNAIEANRNLRALLERE